MKPSVGRIVHFYQQTNDAREISGPFAAIVTHAYDELDQAINLVVFGFDSIALLETMVSAKEFNDRRYWEWPPRDVAPVPAVIDPKALPAPAMPEAVILSGYVPAFEVEAFDPNRRASFDRMSPVERAILGIMREVKSRPPHPWLTDATVLLTAAREKVADYIDRIPLDEWSAGHFSVPPPDGIPPFQRGRDAASEPRVDDTGEDIDPSLRA